MKRTIVMKILYKTIFFLLVFHLTAIGQNHRWELGTLIGVSGYNGDLVQSGIYDANEIHLGYGLFVRNNIHPNLSFRLNFLSGSISGDDANDAELGESRGFQFSSPLTEVSLQVELDLLGHKRYNGQARFKKMITPYVFGGVGYSVFDQTIDYNEAFLSSQGNDSDNLKLLESIANDKKTGAARGSLTIPIGLGLKIDLTEKSTLAFEWGARPSFTDFIDGVSQSGDVENTDWYSFGGATFSVRFGEKDRDKDGVPDSKDLCPNVSGSKAVSGCPDIDQDGIVDNEDACPYEKGYIELNGCPDRDKDGIADKEDECPNEAGILKYNGCPIKDADNDGVPDESDLCPYEVGLAKRNGCPYRDQDGDGVEDNDDRCPDAAGFPFNKGCPDTDNDGIVDVDDDCPRIQGSIEDKGCPKFLKDGIAGFNNNYVLFDEDSDIIKPDYFILLDQIAEVLRKYPDYKLRLEGYSDNRGNDHISQLVAESRAKACYSYFISLGITKDRLIYRGYGENKPIGDNNTTEGRALNRRVEFVLFKSN